jgi:hypothetical protein
MKDDDREAADPAIRPPVAPLASYDNSRMNAFRHGILSRLTVLPWEDQAVYEAMLAALEAEHQPDGPTQAHLVEELAGVLWRKRRLQRAEAASYHRGLQATTESFTEGKTSAAALVGTSDTKAITVKRALNSAPADAKGELAYLARDQVKTSRAMKILEKGEAQAFEQALATLDESTREAWTDQLAWAPGDYDDGETPYTNDAPNLLRYLETSIMPWYDQQKRELKAAPLIRAQAIGESLDPDKLERLGRYEVHLDRKFERTLSTLLRLQELARTRLTRATG